MNKSALLTEEVEYKGHCINIYIDDCPDDPRSWDNMGTFYTAHRHYQPEESFKANFDIEDVCEDGQPGDFSKSFLKEYVALNIYLYDHGGLTISSVPFSCPWDSGWFGMVAVSIEKVKKEYGWKKLTKSRRSKIEKYLQGEIEIYDQYLRGEVYRYEVTPVGDEDNVLESVGGYFGDYGIEEIKADCRAIIDFHIRDGARREHEERQRILSPEIPFPEFAIN